MPMGLPRYWVNTAALSLVLEDTDFLYDGLGPEMRMTRTYNSNNIDQGMFGPGWTFSYESFVKSHLCFDALRQVTLQRKTSDTMVYKADDFICSSGGLITAVPVTATPLMPPGNRDPLTWHPGEAGGRSYWLYEDKKTFLKYRYEGLIVWVNPPPAITLSVSRLISITDSSSNEVTVAYNDDETIKSVTDASGRVTTFAYNAEKRCTSMTLPNGKVLYYQYDASGRLARTIDLMGNETVYTYDTDGFMTSMTVGNKVTTFTYDDKNGTITPKRIASITDAEGKTQTYQWAFYNNSAADMHGNRSYYPANDVGQTTGTENPLADETNRVYEQGLPTSYTDAMGYTTTMQYDARGNLTQKVLPGQRTSTYTYDGADNMTSYKDGAENTWLYQYDDKHLLTKLIRPSGNSTMYAYDAKGQLSTVTDAKGANTTFSYDSYGNISVITDPLGGKWQFTYDAKGILKTAETDPLGHKTNFAYDGNHRLTHVTHADGAITQLYYDCCGLTGMTDPNGNKSVIENNKVLKPVKVTDPIGNSTRYEYDATHNLIKTIDPLGYAVTIARDSLYRPTARTDELGNTVGMTYNANWDRTSFTNARGKKYTFAEMDTLPFSIEDPLKATTYTWWDKNRRLSRWQNARGGGVDFEYSSDGDLVRKTGVYPAESIATYTYDTVRRLTSFTDPSGTTRYTYDAAGRVTGIIWPDSRGVGFIYDAAGNITSLTYPGGFTASYLYDARNRVSSVSWAGNQVQFAYDFAGNLLQMTRSNGTTTRQVFDKRNAAADITHKKGTTVFAQFTLTRNALGNIVSESRTAPVSPGFTSTSETATYNDADQVVQSGGNTFAFDADGNLITVRGTQTWGALYDQMNRLSSITINSVKKDHVYDGLGNRAQTSTGSAVVKYHYDHLARLLFETDGADTLRAVYFYAGRRPVGIWTPASGHLFYHYDSLGSAIALTGSSGNVVAAYAYEPFGRLSQSTGTVYNPFRYIGAYGVMDDGNGIYYMRNRHYDSATGRFLQKDPIGFRGGVNLYVYVGNNPVKRIDPEGLWDEDALITEISGEVTATYEDASWEPNVGEILLGGTTITVGENGTLTMIDMELNQEYHLKPHSEATLGDPYVVTGKFDMFCIETLSEELDLRPEDQEQIVAISSDHITAPGGYDIPAPPERGWADKSWRERLFGP